MDSLQARNSAPNAFGDLTRRYVKTGGGRPQGRVTVVLHINIASLRLLYMNRDASLGRTSQNTVIQHRNAIVKNAANTTIDVLRRVTAPIR